ncbi:MAG: hypothetical protein JWR44_568 [Hymenobacter sp.]|jgi:hypothetical protein|nr:hypothetical protein [Hymenobacter sp.]
MKSFLLYPTVLFSACIISLGTLSGCGKSSSSNPTPATAKLSISRLQTDGTNSMAYVQVKKTSGTPYLLRVGGNTDNYGGTADVTPATDFPTGEYTFRVWFPDVVVNPYYPYNPAPRGKIHTDLIVNGQVKASIDLDASRPTFERDTLSRTMTVQVQ